MIHYYSINSLIKSGIEQEKLEELLSKILSTTLPVKKEYPEYKDWFMHTHVPNLGNNRDILFAIFKNEIIGVINLKYTEEEKKICTLYVKKGFRFQKVGTNLLKMAFDTLGTNKPLITISDKKIFELKKFILANHWEVSQKLDNFYTYDHDEYVFNGSIYVPSKEDTVFKIYDKKKNNIIRITLLTYYYSIKEIFIKKENQNN